MSASPERTEATATGSVENRLLMLGLMGARCHELETRLNNMREQRDKLALAAIEDGLTWREVARAAGFANPYIAYLRRRAAASGGGEANTE